MRPYSSRFVVVVILVVLSSYGETLDGILGQKGSAGSLDAVAELVFVPLVFRRDGLPSVHWTRGRLDYERGRARRIHGSHHSHDAHDCCEVS